MEKSQRPDVPSTDAEGQKVNLTENLDQAADFELRQNAILLLFLVAMFFVPPAITSIGVGLMDEELLKSDSTVRDQQLITSAAISVFFSVISSMWLSTQLSARLKFICSFYKDRGNTQYWIFVSIVLTGLLAFALRNQFDFVFELKSKELKGDDFIRSLIIGSNIIWGILTGFALKAPWDSMRDQVYDSLVKKNFNQGFESRNEGESD